MFKILSGLILSLNSQALTRYFKLKNIAHKFFTLALVLFYYECIEQVPQSERLSQNDANLAYFVACHHAFAILPLLSGYKAFQVVSGVLLFLLAITTLAWPFMSWMKCEITQGVDTDYWFLRYGLMGSYAIVMQVMRIDGLDTI